MLIVRVLANYLAPRHRLRAGEAIDPMQFEDDELRQLYDAGIVTIEDVANGEAGDAEP